jgi:hypothetical protein
VDWILEIRSPPEPFQSPDRFIDALFPRYKASKANPFWRTARSRTVFHGYLGRFALGGFRSCSFAMRCSSSATAE